MKAALDSGDLLTCITTVLLSSGNWNETTHAFILHLQDQVQKHVELNHSQQWLAPMKKVMLKNAVSNIDTLNQIYVQAKQQTAHDGKILTYELCVALLLSAAQTYAKCLEKNT